MGFHAMINGNGPLIFSSMESINSAVSHLYPHQVQRRKYAEATKLNETRYSGRASPFPPGRQHHASVERGDSVYREFVATSCSARPAVEFFPSFHLSIHRRPTPYRI